MKIHVLFLGAQCVSHAPIAATIDPLPNSAASVRVNDVDINCYQVPLFTSFEDYRSHAAIDRAETELCKLNPVARKIIDNNRSRQGLPSLEAGFMQASRAPDLDPQSFLNKRIYVTLPQGGENSILPKNPAAFTIRDAALEQYNGAFRQPSFRIHEVTLFQKLENAQADIMTAIERDAAAQIDALPASIKQTLGIL